MKKEQLELRNLLLDEMRLVVTTSKKLIRKIQEKDLDYRPHPKMRSLLELSNHLAQIPVVDFAILQEKSEQEVRRLEKELYQTDPKRLCNVLETGYLELKNYMLSLSVEDFLNKSTTPFYGQMAISQAKWLIEIVTHMFHHRGQLFNYLKQLGYNVNMFDLYA